MTTPPEAARAYTLAEVRDAGWPKGIKFVALPPHTAAFLLIVLPHDGDRIVQSTASHATASARVGLALRYVRQVIQAMEHAGRRAAT